MTIQCTICMSNLSANECANAATCGHVFHEPCLVQWFNRSKTCPQCRARCDERQVRRLYFSAALNSSMVDVDSLQVDLDDIKLEMRNLKTELDGKKAETKRLRDRQETTKSAFVGLEAELKLAKLQLRNANAEIASNRSELDRLHAVERELNDKMLELKNLEDIKSVVHSRDLVGGVDQLIREHDAKALATIVSMCKNQVKNAKQKRDEVKHHYDNSKAENSKLYKRIAEKTAEISKLESENYNLNEKMKAMNDPNTSRIEGVASTIQQSAVPSIPSLSSSTTPRASIPSSSTTPRTESPYLNIAQSNVGLTPLQNRKRKPEGDPIVKAHGHLTIMNNRRKYVQASRTTTAQSSSLIYNGFGGSERKENFVGFPSSQSRSNPAGRGLLPMSSVSLKK